MRFAYTNPPSIAREILELAEDARRPPPVRPLLDESVPRRLARDLRGQEVKTWPAVGWAGKDNGELLAR